MPVPYIVFLTSGPWSFAGRNALGTPTPSAPLPYSHADGPYYHKSVFFFGSHVHYNASLKVFTAAELLGSSSRPHLATSLNRGPLFFFFFFFCDADLVSLRRF